MRLQLQMHDTQFPKAFKEAKSTNFTPERHIITLNQKATEALNNQTNKTITSSLVTSRVQIRRRI
jgi:hypothetical protein